MLSQDFLAFSYVDIYPFVPQVVRTSSCNVIKFSTDLTNLHMSCPISFAIIKSSAVLESLPTCLTLAHIMSLLLTGYRQLTAS